MGAQPKRKTPRSKQRSRRSQDKLKLGAIVLCSHCRRPHQAHHVCPNCGYYNGREVIVEEPAEPTA